MAIAATSFLTAVAIAVAWRVADLEPWYLGMAAVFFVFALVIAAAPRSWQTARGTNR